MENRGITKAYPTESVRHAAAIYAHCGNYCEVERQTGIDESTIRMWLKTNEEFIAVLDQCRQALRNEHIHQYLTIVSEANAAVIDRLKNGDEIITKDGAVRRRKISGKDAAIIASIATEKSQVLQLKPTTINGDSMARMEALAERLALAMAGRMDAQLGQTIDVTPERKEGTS